MIQYCGLRGINYMFLRTFYAWKSLRELYLSIFAERALYEVPFFFFFGIQASLPLAYPPCTLFWKRPINQGILKGWFVEDGLFCIPDVTMRKPTNLDPRHSRLTSAAVVPLSP